MIKTLRAMMLGRKPAKDFHNDNKTALQMLDREWPALRREKNTPWPTSQPLPEHPQMRYDPIFNKNRLVHLYETCVIVDSPGAHQLKQFTPPVLRRPFPEDEPAPLQDQQIGFCAAWARLGVIAPAPFLISSICILKPNELCWTGEIMTSSTNKPKKRSGNLYKKRPNVPCLPLFQ